MSPDFQNHFPPQQAEKLALQSQTGLLVTDCETARSLVAARLVAGVVSLEFPNQCQTAPTYCFRTGLAEFGIPQIVLESWSNLAAQSLPRTSRILNRALDFANRTLCSDKPLLVHCRLGLERSPAIALSILASWLGKGRELETAALWVGHQLGGQDCAPHNRDLIDGFCGRGGQLSAAIADSLILRRISVLSEAKNTPDPTFLLLEDLLDGRLKSAPFTKILRDYSTRLGIDSKADLIRQRKNLPPLPPEILTTYSDAKRTGQVLLTQTRQDISDKAYRPWRRPENTSLKRAYHPFDFDI
jgi:hypothetical protein